MLHRKFQNGQKQTNETKENFVNSVCYYKCMFRVQFSTFGFDCTN